MDRYGNATSVFELRFEPGEKADPDCKLCKGLGYQMSAGCTSRIYSKCSCVKCEDPNPDMTLADIVDKLKQRDTSSQALELFLRKKFKAAINKIELGGSWILNHADVDRIFDTLSARGFWRDLKKGVLDHITTDNLPEGKNLLFLMEAECIFTKTTYSGDSVTLDGFQCGICGKISPSARLPFSHEKDCVFNVRSIDTMRGEILGVIMRVSKGLSESGLEKTKAGPVYGGGGSAFSGTNVPVKIDPLLGYMGGGGGDCHGYVGGSTRIDRPSGNKE